VWAALFRLRSAFLASLAFREKRSGYFPLIEIVGMVKILKSTKQHRTAKEEKWMSYEFMSVEINTALLLSLNTKCKFVM
jgi:hypothetical protein